MLTLPTGRSISLEWVEHEGGNRLTVLVMYELLGIATNLSKQTFDYEERLGLGLLLVGLHDLSYQTRLIQIYSIWIHFVVQAEALGGLTLTAVDSVGSVAQVVQAEEELS